MKTNSTWCAIDRAAIDRVTLWSRESVPHVSRTKIAEILGYSPYSMYKKFKYQFAPLTIGEFEHLCTVFKKDPNTEWLSIHQTAALRRGDWRTAAIFRHIRQDQRIKREIVNLALTYLDEKDVPEVPPETGDWTANDNDHLHDGHTDQRRIRANGRQCVYLMNEFCKFSLPYTDPGDIGTWKRRNGNTLYTVHPARYVDENGKGYVSWLYGKIGRLMLIWVSTQVMLGKADDNRTLTLPRSLNKLMLELGIDRKQGKPNSRDYRRFRQTILALCGTNIQITTYAGNGVDVIADDLISIADQAGMRWGSRTSGGTSVITLDKSTWERMKHHSTPLDAATVMLLTTTNPVTKGRSKGQDLDLYAWLSNFTHVEGTRRMLPITWRQLANQFGNTYGEQKNFVQNFKKSLGNVQAVWPDLNVEVIDGQGIILHQSKRSVKPKHEIIER